MEEQFMGFLDTGGGVARDQQVEGRDAPGEPAVAAKEARLAARFSLKRA